MSRIGLNFIQQKICTISFYLTLLMVGFGKFSGQWTQISDLLFPFDR